MSRGGPQRIVVPGEGVVLAAPGVDAAWVAAALAVHRSTLDPERVLKKNLGTLVTRVDARLLPAPGPGVTGDIVVKEAPRRRARPWFLGFLRRSSSFARDFQVADRLRQVGVATPRIVACSLEPAGTTELAISEHAAGAVPLRDLLWLGDRVLAEEAARHALLVRVGEWLRRIHDGGVWQRDMKPSNVLLRGDTLLLVDISAVRLRKHGLDLERRTRNLAQLLDLPPEVERSARSSLLQYYLAAGGDSPAKFSEWDTRVASAIEARRAARERRSGFRFVDEEHFRRRLR